MSDSSTYAHFWEAHQIPIVVVACTLLLLVAGMFFMRSRWRIDRISRNDMERSLEYQRLFTEATKGLYESVYEVDVTRNRSDSEETRRYFESLGIPGDMPLDKALRHIANVHIRAEDRQAYLETVLPENILQNYRAGVRSTRCECMITADGKNYYWLRILTRAFVLPSDQSVRMIVYRQNIDAEKRHWRLYQHQQLIMEATKGLYENVYEMDITNNCAGSEETKHYFERLGIPGDTPFDKALVHIAEKQIREEDRQGYLETFSPRNLLKAYAEGVHSLSCDFMISTDGKSYYWLRVLARIYLMPLDQSVRLIIFRQNIDAEKRHWKTYQYQQMLMEAAKGLYENIYEMDMTHNRAGNEETSAYFASLGLSGDAPYDQFLHCVAETQIRPEHRQRYLDAFLPENVLKGYERGIDSRSCEVMLSTDGAKNHWLRITARIFFWDEDKSVRIFSFRQNIDEEKMRESRLSAQARLDSLTCLYNKAATEALIGEALAQRPNERTLYAFFILDIDNFKVVNDQFGHAAGDTVIREFSCELKHQFRDSDIVGRIGGDEFVAFLAVPSRGWVEKKARKLVACLRKSLVINENIINISASIGVSIAPGDGMAFTSLYICADAALYETKNTGKDGFTLYDKSLKSSVSCPILP